MSSQFIAGDWYLLITCSNCSVRHTLFSDLNQGQSKAKGSYLWTCPSCDHRREYDSESLERYHHAVAGD